VWRDNHLSSQIFRYLLIFKLVKTNGDERDRPQVSITAMGRRGGIQQLSTNDMPGRRAGKVAGRGSFLAEGRHSKFESVLYCTCTQGRCDRRRSVSLKGQAGQGSILGGLSLSCLCQCYTVRDRRYRLILC